MKPCLVAVAALLVIGVVNPVTVSAAAPIFVTATIDREKELSASEHVCDFPIIVHEQGTWELSFHFGRDGTVREIRHARLTITYTNADTGESISGTQTRGLNLFYDVAPPVEHDDGSVTFTDEFRGAFQNVVIPEIGSISHDAGRLLTTHTVMFEPEFALLATTATVIAGRNAPLTSKLCDALS